MKKSPPVIRVVYKNEKDALAAVQKFNGQPADGRILSVKIVGNINASLSGRLSIPVGDSVDVLMEDTPSSTGSCVCNDLSVTLRFTLSIGSCAPMRSLRKALGLPSWSHHLGLILRSIRKGLSVVVVEVEDGVAEEVAAAAVRHAWISTEVSCIYSPTQVFLFLANCWCGQKYCIYRVYSPPLFLHPLGLSLLCYLATLLASSPVVLGAGLLSRCERAAAGHFRTNLGVRDTESAKWGQKAPEYSGHIRPQNPEARRLAPNVGRVQRQSGKPACSRSSPTRPPPLSLLLFCQCSRQGCLLVSIHLYSCTKGPP